MATSVSIPREKMIELVQTYITNSKEEEAKRIASFDADMATWQSQVEKECLRVAALAKTGKLKTETYSSTVYTIRTKVPNPAPIKAKSNELSHAKKHLAMLKASNQTSVTVSDNNDWGRYL